MDNLLKEITNHLDVIAHETNIIVKDKNGIYYEPEYILTDLSKIWNKLSKAKRERISRAYMESNLKYYSNKKECDKMLYKTTKLMLSALIQPIENIEEKHIIYDYNIKKFMSSDKATNKNLINCWHFDTKNKKTDEVLYILDKVHITKYTNLLDFLLQEIEFLELYLQILF